MVNEMISQTLLESAALLCLPLLCVALLIGKACLQATTFLTVWGKTLWVICVMHDYRLTWQEANQVVHFGVSNLLPALLFGDVQQPSRGRAGAHQ